MNKNEVKKIYEDSCVEYTKIMIDQLFKEDADPKDTFWVGNEIGGVFYVNDYFFSMRDIKILVDNNIDFDTFDDWYQYNLDIHYGEELGEEKAVPFTLEFWWKNKETIQEYRVSEYTLSEWKHKWLEVFG